MTRSTPKKKTQPKKTTQAAPKAPEPMDPDAIEVDPSVWETQEQAAEAPQEVTVAPQEVEQAESPSDYRRVAYAAQTLATEFLALFPETPVEYSGANGRGTALDVTFDLTTLGADAEQAAALLALTKSDERVDYVLTGEDSSLVSFRSNARTQDSREPFMLRTAWSVLTGSEGQDS